MASARPQRPGHRHPPHVHVARHPRRPRPVPRHRVPGHRRRPPRLLAWSRAHGPPSWPGSRAPAATATSWPAPCSRRHQVVEVNRPDRANRRRKGKNDPVDAEAAARAVLAGQATAVPKSRDGAVEALRALTMARNSAVKATHPGEQPDQGAAGRRRPTSCATSCACRACSSSRPAAAELHPDQRPRSWPCAASVAAGCTFTRSHRPRQAIRATRPRTAPDAGRAARHRHPHRRAAADHRRRQPRAAAQRRRLRRAVRRQPGPGQHGQRQPPPPQPRRRPRRQQRPVDHRHHPAHPRPTHPRVRRATTRPGRQPQGHPARPQALHRPRNLRHHPRRTGPGPHSDAA